MSGKVRAFVVDDSAFFRRRVTEMLESHPAIEVVGEAKDGKIAISEVRRLKPDVITMDVEMPVMDGISAVKRIMAETPTPILMFSSLTKEGASATLDALEAGALDFLPKQFFTLQDRELTTETLTQRVLAISKRQYPIPRHTSPIPDTAEPKRRMSPPAEAGPTGRGGYKLVAIGASTGGPVAIRKLLSALPEHFSVPILLIVHMPESFTLSFAQRLNLQCRIKVKEAENGEPLRAGQAYLAPGGRQMLLEPGSGGTVIRISDADAGQIYRPCVDISLGSAAMAYPGGVLAVVLTGMGQDGKLGAKLLKDHGSTVWSQDEASCVVYGMPQAVEKAGLSDRVLPLDDIGPMLGQVV